MEVNKTELEILQNAIKEWEEDGMIGSEQATSLRKSITMKRSDRQLLARYFFIISLSCAILAFGAIFIDEKLLERLKHYFSLSNIIIAAITGLLSLTWFWYAWKRKNGLSPIRYEVYMIMGALCSISSLVYIFKDINADGPLSALLICTALLLFALAATLRSLALWASGIMAFLMWFGSFSSNMSSHNLFLGMNLALRFTAMGLCIIAVSYGQKFIKPLTFSSRITFCAGLLVFLLAMWAVSLFGNFGSLDEWWKVRQSNELVFAIISGLASLGVFYLGLKFKDAYTRDIGIVFLLINLYTRYFEYFWDTMNKGIFFLVLALTFGLLGRWLERSKRKARKEIRA